MAFRPAAGVAWPPAPDPRTVAWTGYERLSSYMHEYADNRRESTQGSHRPTGRLGGRDHEVVGRSDEAAHPLGTAARRAFGERAGGSRRRAAGGGFAAPGQAAIGSTGQDPARRDSDL